MDEIKLLIEDPVVFCVVDLEPTVGRDALQESDLTL